jgi:protein SCO1/2
MLLLAAPVAAHDNSHAANQEAPPSAEASMRGSYGGPFILQDHNGKTVEDEEYRGKYMLLTFGYTNCGDVCPTELQTMAKVMDLLGDDAKQVQPLFITVDPERDTPAKLRDYVAAFHPRLIGLTGPAPYIAAAARKYRIKYEKVIGQNDSYTMDHTAVIFLMGPDGGFLDRFAFSTPADRIAARLRHRMAEQAAAAAVTPAAKP